MMLTPSAFTCSHGGTPAFVGAIDKNSALLKPTSPPGTRCTTARIFNERTRTRRIDDRRRARLWVHGDVLSLSLDTGEYGIRGRRGSSILRPSFLRRFRSHQAGRAGASASDPPPSPDPKLSGCAAAILNASPRLAQCWSAVAAALLAARRWVGARPWFCYGQNLVRSEASVSAAILVIAPLFLLGWAKMEAEYHDTLECRTVLQTYLIAAGGCVCAALASIAGKPMCAVALQAAWRAAAARSLWTWVDLGRGLFDRPGWLHGAVARWRILAAAVSLFGVAARLLVLLTGHGGLQSAFSWPVLQLLPPWLVAYTSTPDEKFRLSAAQIWSAVGVYVWVFYYLCFFVPYRLLYEDYQNYSRRAAQFNKDLTNGDATNVLFSTKLGPDFPRHLKERMARMEPGHERDILEVAGIIRKKSCSATVVEATKFKKNKEGKWAMRMTPLEPGDMTYWGSDLWDRLDQQERRDKQMGGWTPPLAAGAGMYKYNRVAYSRIMREIQAELGKTDEEMDEDLELSPLNLMRFEPQAEEGAFDLVMQQKSPIDAAGENVRLKADGHELVVVSNERLDGGLDSAYLNRADLDEDDEGRWQWDRAGQLTQRDSFSYNKDDRSGQVLQDSIRKAKVSKTESSSSSAAADAAQETLRKKKIGAIDASSSSPSS